MRKLRILIVLILAITMSGVAIFLIRSGARKMPVFSIKDGNRIGRIELDDGKTRVVMKKAGDVWILNDSLVARNESVTALLSMMEQLSVKSPVSEKTRIENVRDHDPVSVSFFSKGIKKRSFIVYYLPENNPANIALKTRKGPAYILQFPGYAGNVGAWFRAMENYWKPVDLFTFGPGELRSVRFQNIEQPGQSFRITRDSVNIFKMHDAYTGAEIPGVDQQRAARYFSYFFSIQFERFLEPGDIAGLGFIVSPEPEFIINVTGADGTEKAVTSYALLSGPDPRSSTAKSSDWTLLRISNEKTPVLISYFRMDPIIKTWDYFIRH